MLANNFIKSLAVLVVCCLFSISVFSQTVYSNKESSTFSFTVGLTSSNLFHDTIGYSSDIYFNAGFMYTVVCSDKLNVGIEVLYTGKAVKKELPLTKYRFTYIDLPIYLQYKFSENIRANLGIQYSKLIDSQYSYLDGSNASGMHSKSLDTRLGNDYGVLLGAEIDITKNITIAGRYTLSTKSFLDKASPYFGVFQFSISYVAFRSYKQFFHKKESLSKDGAL
jgi:hypothetical protein